MDSEEGNGASQHPCSSDVALRKMVAEEVDRRLNTLRGELPLAVIEGLLRKVVREEFEKHLTEGTRNEVAEERSLYLKFLDSDNRGEYDGMNGVEPRALSEIFEADPNDMDPVQLNGGCQTSYEYNEAWIEELLPTCFVDEYSHIEMSNGDDERAAAAVVNASIRWKQLFCVVTWTFSSSSVGHPPKRKKQRVG